MTDAWRQCVQYNAVLDGYFWLRKSSLSEKVLSSLRSEMSVQSATNNFVTGKPTAMFTLAREDETWFGVPPAFKHDLLPRPDFEIKHYGLEREIQFGGEFKSWRTDYDQKDVAEKMLQALLTSGSGLLCLDTGMGKTLVALWLIASLGVKTLVVVHKKDSIIQFTKQAHRFLPGCKVGEMRASVRRTKDMDIVLTTVQSLSKGKYSPELLSEFGFVVADEIHLMVAEVFHLAFTYLRCRYRLGLTATPERVDGLGIIIEWFFGQPVVTIRQPRSDVFVRALHYQAGDQKLLWLGNPANKKPNFTGMVTRLVNDNWRNQLIAKEICEQAISTTGQILVISERKAHVAALAALVSKLAPTRAETAQAPEKVLVIASMVGDDKDEQRQDSKRADIVVSTLKLAKETLDMPNLTRLIVTTPISKNIVQQLRGRLLRTTEEETKARGQNLVLSHLCDDWDSPGMFNGMFWGCCRFYKAEGYKIQHINFNTDTMEALFPT
jgi:superfamily II DNA or RNA helicase